MIDAILRTETSEAPDAKSLLYLNSRTEKNEKIKMMKKNNLAGRNAEFEQSHKRALKSRENTCSYRASTCKNRIYSNISPDEERGVIESTH